MKTQEHKMRAAKCEACGYDGPMAHSVDGAKTLARALGWVEEKGVTRCPPCRSEMRRAATTGEGR